MDPLYIVLGISLMAAMWFMPVGVIRLLAYHHGGIDHTDGMHNVARIILAIGLLGLVVSAVVGLVLLTRG